MDSSSTQAASINTGSLIPVASVSKIMVLDIVVIYLNVYSMFHYLFKFQFWRKYEAIRYDAVGVDKSI